jgi:two-component system chemotaxis sensor kinase CheA
VIRESGKTVRLEFSGEETQIDKLIVDRMLEPLLHLVSNAASHGIETVDTRRARGKPAEGRITLRARASGDRVVFEAEDDGAGVDVERVRERARTIGIVAEDRALSDDELLDLICAPGFSPRASADPSTGRGAGMSVVRSAIRALGGELSLSSAPGRGTRFVLELPLTLMITDALLVEVGGQIMAVPQLSVREILQLEPSTVTSLEDSDVISYRGSVLPLITLHRVFNMTPAADARPHVLVVGSDTQATGLVVDRLMGLREIVVQPITDSLLAIPGIGGATALADGRIGLIIDAAALVRRTRASVRARRATAVEAQVAAGATRP